MVLSYDPEKDKANLAKHGISLARAEDLQNPIGIEDTRRNYGEPRYRAFGFIDGVPYCLAYTIRNGDVRAISLRRARAKEMKRYAP